MKGERGTGPSPPRAFVREILEKRSGEAVDARDHRAQNGDRMLKCYFVSEQGRLAAMAHGHTSCLDMVFPIDKMNEKALDTASDKGTAPR